MLLSNTLPGSDRSVLLQGAPMVGELQNVPAFCGPMMGIGDPTYDELPLAEALGLRGDAHYKTIMVRGNSMEPQIPHGSKVFYDPACVAQSGDIIVVSLNDNLFVKQLYVEPHGSLWLLSINPECGCNYRVLPNDRLQILGVYVNHVACAISMERDDIDRRIRSWYEAHGEQREMDNDHLRRVLLQLIQARWSDEQMLVRKKRDWAFVFRAVVSHDRYCGTMTLARFEGLLDELLAANKPSFDSIRRGAEDLVGDFPNWTCPPSVANPREFRRILDMARFVYSRL